MKKRRVQKWLGAFLAVALLICPCINALALENSEQTPWEKALEWSREQCPKRGGEAHECTVRICEATCTMQGSKALECEYCHISYTYETIPKKAHEYDLDHVETQESSTCTEPSKRVYHCKNCSAKMSISIPASNHIWESAEEDGWTPLLGDEPSCLRKGTLIRRCARCGFTEKKEGQQKEHQPVVSKEDCTRIVCSVCGTDLRASGNEHKITWSALGAQNMDGIHIGTCSECGTTIRANHTYLDDGDCTTPVFCPECGLLLQEGSGGHNKYPLFDENKSPYYEGIDNGDGTHTRICTNEGCVQPTGVKEKHQFNKAGKCIVCNAETTVEDVHDCGGNAHQWSETITEPANCMKQGRSYQKCEVCGIQKDVELFPKTDHSFGEWITTTAPQIGVKGEKQRVCSVCGYRETDTVPALEVPEHEHEFVQDPNQCDRDQCTVCGQTRPNGKTHIVEKWDPENSTDASHTGRCAVCNTVVTEKHVYTDDGDCTTEVICEICGQVVKSGCEEHRKYPLFDENNQPYYRGVDNGDGTHTRLCTNEGCVQPTGVIEQHQYDENGKCQVCDAQRKQNDNIPQDPTPQEPAPQEPTPQEPAPQEPAPQDPTPQDPAPQEPAPQDPTPQEPASQDPTPQEPAPQDPTPQEPEPQETAPQESTPQETSSHTEVELLEGIDGECRLTFQNVTATDSAVKKTVGEKFTEYVAYDLTLFNGTKIVQPDGTVKVAIRLPEGWSNVDVYHVDGDSMTKMTAVVENGNVVFTTTHFSVYVLVNNDSAKEVQEAASAAAAPKTGDRENGFLALFLTGCLFLAYSVRRIYVKKRG